METQSTMTKCKPQMHHLHHAPHAPNRAGQARIFAWFDVKQGELFCCACVVSLIADDYYEINLY